MAKIRKLVKIGKPEQGVPVHPLCVPVHIGQKRPEHKVYRYIGLVTSRAEPSFEHFELGLLIYEWARARAELLNELKIRLKLGLI